MEVLLWMNSNWSATAMALVTDGATSLDSTDRNSTMTTPLSTVTDDSVQPLFTEYPDEVLHFAVGACVLFTLIGVPGNFITIVALLRYTKVSFILDEIFSFYFTRFELFKSFTHPNPFVLRTPFRAGNFSVRYLCTQSRWETTTRQHLINHSEQRNSDRCVYGSLLIVHVLFFCELRQEIWACYMMSTHIA